MEYMIRVYGHVECDVEEDYTIEADSQEEALRIFNEKYSDDQLISDLGSSVDVVVSNNPDLVEITDISISSNTEEFEDENGNPAKRYSNFIDVNEIDGE